MSNEFCVGPISFTQTPLKLFSFFVPNEPTPWHDEWPHVEVALSIYLCSPFLELKRGERVILRSCKRFCPCDRSPMTESHSVIAPTIRHHRAAAGWRAIAAKMSNSIECGQPLSSDSFQVIVIASYRSFFSISTGIMKKEAVAFRRRIVQRFNGWPIGGLCNETPESSHWIRKLRGRERQK